MNNHSKSEKKDNDNVVVKFISFRNLIDAFLANPEKCIQYKITIYHREVLRVIARYCDLPLGYCCVKQNKLAPECGMVETKFRYIYLDLKGKNLLFVTKRGKMCIYRIGEILTGISNE